MEKLQIRRFTEGNLKRRAGFSIDEGLKISEFGPCCPAEPIGGRPRCLPEPSAFIVAGAGFPGIRPEYRTERE